MVLVCCLPFSLESGYVVARFVGLCCVSIDRNVFLDVVHVFEVFHDNVIIDGGLWLFCCVSRLFVLG